VWSCDPMHGNTITLDLGLQDSPLRPRPVGSKVVLFDSPPRKATHAGGVHLEMTGSGTSPNCIGGARAITDEDLNDRYHTACDPRPQCGAVDRHGFPDRRIAQAGARRQSQADGRAARGTLSCSGLWKATINTRNGLVFAFRSEAGRSRRDRRIRCFSLPLGLADR